MTYNYISIVNEVLRGFGETLLTSSTFTAADGFQGFVKEQVNIAINDILTEQDYKWSFQKTTGTQVLTAGTIAYTLPAGYTSVAWNSFYIDRDAALLSPEALNLTLIDEDTYIQFHKTTDINTTVATSYTKPRYVVNVENGNYIVTPKPKEAYTVKFTYYAGVTEMATYSDVPLVPERYRVVIMNRMRYYCYLFRDNVEEADRAEKEYKKGVSFMARTLFNKPHTMRTGF